MSCSLALADDDAHHHISYVSKRNFHGPFATSLQDILQQSLSLSMVDSNEAQQEHLCIAIQEKYSKMVHDFWNTNTTDTNNGTIGDRSSNNPALYGWITLPSRIHALVHRMEEIVDFLLQLSRKNNGKNDVSAESFFRHMSTIVTASLFVGQRNGRVPHSSESNSMYAVFQNFFTAALGYNCTKRRNNNKNFSDGEHEDSLLLEDCTDWTTVQNLFESWSNQDEFVFVYQNLRRLGWIQEPYGSSSPSFCSSATTRTYLLQESLFNGAVQKIITKKVRSMILGNYDDDLRAASTTDDDFNHTISTTAFQSIIRWTDRTIVPWLCYDVFGIDRNVNDVDENPLMKNIQDHVHRLVLQTYWTIRLSEIFDIVTSYPDSLPAIVELKQVFNLYVQTMNRSTTANRVHQQHDLNQCYDQFIQELSLSLRKSFVVRLNHPGANTTQMIDIYIAAIQVLRILLQDTNHNSTTTASSSLCMSSKRMNTIIAYITEPVRSYLRHYRNDTVRCILTSLTSTGSGGQNTTNTTNNYSSNVESTSNHVLYQELRRQDTKPLEYMTMNSDDEDDDEEDCPTMDWQPRPSINARTIHQNAQQNHYHRSGSNNSKNNSDSDILAMLVSIYGSKELFVNEYRSMLADKLLGSNYEDSTDQDIHTLELLKLRFGEMSLINAEVMIKDIEDSARTNKNIRDSFITKKTSSDAASSNVIVADAAIVSHIFWPKLHTSSFKHHPRIQILLDEYATIYAEQKNPRILQWYNHLGSIQVELDVVEEQMDAQNGTLSTTFETKEFSCSPLLATLISHFEDEPIWTAEQLSNETNLPDHIIVRQMSFWVTQRVVVLTTPTMSHKVFPSTYDTSKITYTLASKAEQNDSSKGSA